MNLIQALVKDESGFVLSAEAVTVGTVGVLGALAGLSVVGNAVNGEMKEMASAFRSLDQSYGFVGHRAAGAWTAGSSYIQPDVQQSLAELSAEGQTDVKTLQQKIEADRKSYSKQPKIADEPTPTPLPNQLPGADSNKADQPKPEPTKAE